MRLRAPNVGRTNVAPIGAMGHFRTKPLISDAGRPISFICLGPGRRPPPAVSGEHSARRFRRRRPLSECSTWPPSIARRARSPAGTLARRARQRSRRSFGCAPMPVLRRPDDHRRDVRRRTPRALAIANPHQDRHLMIVIAVLPASQPRSASLPAAPRSRRALSSQRRRTPSERRAHAKPSYARDRTRSSSSFPPIRRAASGLRRHMCDPSPTLKSP